MANEHSGSPKEEQREAHLLGERELEGLGYEQQLNRALSLIGNLALTVAAITPASAILIIGPVALTGAGTGALWAYLLTAVIAVCMALCFAELGSMYPTSGGEYPIITRVLGKQAGIVDMVNIAVLLIFIPASIALGFGTYLSTLLPGIDPNLTSCAAVLAATGLALLSISDNAWITMVLVALELVLLTALVVLGFSSVEQPVSVLVDPVSVSASGASTAVGFGLIFAVVTTALFSYNGYDAAINFSEETRGEAAKIGRGVMFAVLIATVFQFVPLAAIILAAPDLGRFLNAESPFIYVVESVLGPAGNTVVTLGILVAVFAAVQAIILTSARVLYSTGRDMAWPSLISASLTRISARYSTPWVATLVVGLPAAALTLFSSAVDAVTFSGVVVAVNYALVATAAIVSRVRHRGRVRPWRMPLWPLPPAVALVGVFVALSQQGIADLLSVAAISVVALTYYVLYLRPRSATHWRARDLSDEDPQQHPETERQEV